MEANDDRVAAALRGSRLAPSGLDLVLAEWDEAWCVPEGMPSFRLGEDTVQATAGAFEDHDGEPLGWP